MGHSKIVGAIEIGTSKIAIIIGEISSDSSLNIIGSYSVQSNGVKKGVIEDLQVTGQIVHNAILQAETEAGTEIEEIYLAQTGQHLAGVFNFGTTNVGASNGIITKADVEKAKEDARRPQLPEGRSFIHYIQNPFSVDGKKVENPIHMEGKRLQVGFWAIHADNKILQDSLRVIMGIPLVVEDVIVSSIASGNALLQESEKKAGALVIDIGGGTSDFALYKDGYVVYTGVIPVGGDHISNDLSMGLRTSVQLADSLKLREGLASHAKQNTDASAWLVGNQSIGDRKIPLISVNRIVESRIKELFELVREALEEAKLYNPSEIGSGVILTGGTSRMEGIEVIAEKVFDLKCTKGECTWNIDKDLNIPEYSTTLGLLLFALGVFEEKQSKNTNNILGNLLRKFLPKQVNLQ
ncbi:MAG: cell division protein FtsA [Opitutales bacterium]|jgi:cell division protein FtsA